MSTLVPPEGYEARSATLDDAEAVTELVNICGLADLGHPTTDLSNMLNDWQSPYCNPATNARLVLAGERLVGYASVWIEPPCVVLHGSGRVHPDYKGRGIGTYLAQWLRATVTELALPQAPEGAKVVLEQTKSDFDEDSRALLLAQGYRPVRHLYRMLIDLDAPSPAPSLPAGLHFRTFDRARDLGALVRAEQEIFQDHWGYVVRDFDQDFAAWEHWIDHDEHHDPTLWFLVMDGTEIAGVCLCDSFVAGEPEMGYVGSLGVKRAWRRQGVGLAMLHQAFGEFYRRGKRQASLHVDAQSLTGATRLYEKAGMHVQRTSIAYELLLRDGEDLSTQTLDA